MKLVNKQQTIQTHYIYCRFCILLNIEHYAVLTIRNHRNATYGDILRKTSQGDSKSSYYNTYPTKCSTNLTLREHKTCFDTH